MFKAHDQRSEVARLLSQISVEYEAAQRGLMGLSYGMSQHDFITARMENMGQIHSQLELLVGGDAAIAMIADRLNSPNQ
jgi:ABC-type Fe2+-enterobactin transport system substrate-binding protein